MINRISYDVSSLQLQLIHLTFETTANYNTGMIVLRIIGSGRIMAIEITTELSNRFLI